MKEILICPSYSDEDSVTLFSLIHKQLRNK